MLVVVVVFIQILKRIAWVCSRFIWCADGRVCSWGCQAAAVGAGAAGRRRHSSVRRLQRLPNCSACANGVSWGCANDVNWVCALPASWACCGQSWRLSRCRRFHVDGIWYWKGLYFYLLNKMSSNISISKIL